MTETGYDISDPKHPEHHSVHVDLWDARDKFERGESSQDGRGILPPRSIHWEVTVLEGVAELFATNSLPLAVRMLERMGETGSDLDAFALIVQPRPGEWPRSLTYDEAREEAGR